MKILPKIEIKQLEECVPGELVRFLAWSDSDLGLLAKDARGERDIFVGLAGMKQQFVPYYWWMESKPDSVLSYGFSYNIDVDHDRLFDLNAHASSIENGSLVLWPSGWTMKVFPERGSGRHMALYYEFATGKLAQAPYSISSAAFASWSLHLDPERLSEQRPRMLVKYPLASKS